MTITVVARYLVFIYLYIYIYETKCNETTIRLVLLLLIVHSALKRPVYSCPERPKSPYELFTLQMP